MEETQTQSRTKVLANGAVYDLDKKRIVDSSKVTTKITSQNAVAYANARQEAKRARILAGAAKTLERSGDWDMPNDLDVVEAIGEAVMMKALNPDNAKQVDAARLILQESGLAEARQPETVNNTMNVLAVPAEILDALTTLHSRLLSATNGEDGVVIDGKIAYENINSQK